MSIEQVDFFNVQQARAFNPPESSALISIYDPNEPPPEMRPGWREILQIAFADKTHDAESIREMRPKIPYIYWDHFHKPHAEAIRDFLDYIAMTEIAQLYVHCHHGRSRSAAVAQFACEKFGVNFHSRYSPFYYPNHHVYTLLKTPDLYTREWMYAGGFPIPPGLVSKEEPAKIEQKEPFWKKFLTGWQEIL